MQIFLVFGPDALDVDVRVDVMFAQVNGKLLLMQGFDQ